MLALGDDTHSRGQLNARQPIQSDYGNDPAVTRSGSATSTDAHPAELRVLQPADGVCVIEVGCELDMLTTPALRLLLIQELAGGHRVVLVDFSGCDFMGSTGLTVLVEARERARQKAIVHLALAGLTRTVSRALAATGLEPLFDIYPTAWAALSRLTATEPTCSDQETHDHGHDARAASRSALRPHAVHPGNP